MGFAQFAASNEVLAPLQNLLHDLAFELDWTCMQWGMGPGYQIAVFGEWCGGDIQKNVALSQLEPMFVIFEVLIIHAGIPRWFGAANRHEMVEHLPFDRYHFGRQWDELAQVRVFPITIFPVWTMEIDFSLPTTAAAQKLQEITDQVEKCCPVGKQFGVEGVGEGVVWRGEAKTSTVRFKVKGEKHAVTKNPKDHDIDSVADIKSKQEFVDRTVTEARMLPAGGNHDAARVHSG